MGAPETSPLATTKRGDDVVVEQTIGPKQPRLGKVTRTTDLYVWVAVEGLRDTLRVARVSGRGTVHGTSFLARSADQETIAAIARAIASDRVRTELYIVNAACTRMGPVEALRGLSLAELRELELTLLKVGHLYRSVPLVT